MQSSSGNRPRSGSGYNRSSGSRDQRRPQRRRYQRRRPKVCEFCVAKVDTIDYKRIDILEKSLTERGKIKGRRKTGTCAKHQRRLAVAVKRARFLALLPYTAGHVHTGQPTARPVVQATTEPEATAPQVIASDAEAQDAVTLDIEVEEAEVEAPVEQEEK